MFWVRLLVGVLCGAVVGFIVIATWSYRLKWLYNPDTKRLFESVMQELEDDDKWKFTDSHCYAMHKSGVTIYWWKRSFFNVDMYDGGTMQVGFTVQQKWKIHRKLKKMAQRMAKRAEKSEFGTYGNKANIVAAQILQHNLTGTKVDYDTLKKEAKNADQ